MKLCSSCSVFLRPHSTLVWWMKCPCCGFTGFYLDEIHPNKRNLAEKNKMAIWDEAIRTEHSDPSDICPAANKKCE
jgi:hypothetical protein